MNFSTTLSNHKKYYCSMPNNFILRIGDGKHFNASSSKSIWGINTIKSTHGKWFVSRVKEGDLLWFVTGKSNGLIVAVATFTSIQPRVLGPLLALTLTNSELGWDKSEGEWDTEVHYKDLYNLTDCKLFSEIKSTTTIREFNHIGDKSQCKIDLITEYQYIVRYSKVRKSM